MRGLLPSVSAALLGVAGAVVLTGCSVGAAGPDTSDVQLTVTRDFGARPVVQAPPVRLVAAETVLGLLGRATAVRTGARGQIRSIAGVEAGGSQAWTLHVNGIEVTRRPREVDVQPGDRVWWDLRDTRAARRVGAVVGSYPAPFVTGTGGKRLPVTIECGVPGGRACSLVGEALQRFGVPTGQSSVGSSGGAKAFRVLVGPWARLRIDPGLTALERGPRHSGVYVRIAPDGRTISALEPSGRVARRLGPGAGLVAAARLGGPQPVWIVTGTNGAGLEAAARAFAEGETTLGNHYALAIAHEQGVPLPVEAPRP